MIEATEDSEEDSEEDSAAWAAATASRPHGISSGNRIVPTWKATSGGGGIGSSISETTQTAAAGRIVMEASTKIGTSMHEGQQQRRRSCRGGQKSGGVDDDIGSSSHQRWRCGRGGGKSGGVDGDNRIARRRSSGKRWRFTWRVLVGGLGGIGGGNRISCLRRSTSTCRVRK